VILHAELIPPLAGEREAGDRRGGDAILAVADVGQRAVANPTLLIGLVARVKMSAANS